MDKSIAKLVKFLKDKETSTRVKTNALKKKYEADEELFKESIKEDYRKVFVYLKDETLGVESEVKTIF